MDDNKNNVTNSLENKSNLKTYKGDIYFIAILIVLTILFPFGVIFYIWGRLNLMIHFLILASFALDLLMLLLCLTGIVRFLKKNIWKKKIVTFLELCLPALFIISYFLPFRMYLNLYDSNHPFLCGYRDRIRSRLDIKEVREWMETYNANYTTKNKNEFIDEYIPPDKLPDCLKPIRYGGVFKYFSDIFGNQKIIQFCGASMTHWRLVIGMEDMPFPDSEFYEEHGIFWLPVAPGVYVDMD